MAMKVEQAGAPTAGTALAYFVVKFASHNLEWLGHGDEVEAVAMLGILFTYIIMGARSAWRSVTTKLNKPRL